MSTVTIDIRPEHIRAALQSAAGLEIKFPSLAAERHIARFLSRVNWTVVSLEHPAPTPGVHYQDATNYEPESEPEFIVEFPLNGRWVRSADYPETYTPAQASKILHDDLAGLKVGYRVVYK